MIDLQIDGAGKEITDNEYHYYIFLYTVVMYSDPNCSLYINKTKDKISTIIRPSNPNFRQDIIDNILLMHRHLMIKVNFSKSTNIQKNVYYHIDIG